MSRTSTCPTNILRESFHGVPYMLYTDQGAMFKSAPVRSFLSAMDVRQRWHAPGNARAAETAARAQREGQTSLEGV